MKDKKAKRKRKRVALSIKIKSILALAWEQGFAEACLQDSNKAPQNPYAQAPQKS